MYDRALRWSMLLTVLLSVLFPVGAYFGVAAVYIFVIKARKSRQVLAELINDKPLLVVLFCLLLSFMYSQDKLMSAGAMVLLSLNLGLYLVLVSELKSLKLHSYFRLLDIICLLACVYGTYQFFSGNLVLNKSWVDEKTFGSVARVYSTLLNPNIFAEFLVINLSFAIARFKTFKEDMLLTLGILLASFCLLLTYSRGGFIAFTASVLMLCILKEKRKGAVIYLLSMTAAFYIFNLSGAESRADLGAVYRDSSSLYRLEIWKAALFMFLEHPVFGNGIGTTWYYLSSNSDKLFRYILHSHNIYLQVAAELGATGLLTFLYLLFCKLWEAYRIMRYRAAGIDAQVMLGFIAGMAGIMVHGLVDAVVFVPAMSLVMMGYLALHGRIASEYEKEYTKPILLPLFESKCIFKLFGSEGAYEDKYEKEESKAYQA